MAIAHLFFFFLLKISRKLPSSQGLRTLSRALRAGPAATKAFRTGTQGFTPTRLAPGGRSDPGAGRWDRKCCARGQRSEGGQALTQVSKRRVQVAR